MRIRPFGVEQWMNAYETRCAYNLAETCVESLTVDQLLRLCGEQDLMAHLAPMKLTYGDIEGSPRLRAAIAGLYAHQTAENVLVTHGAIGANHLVYLSLVEPGDQVVSVLPAYQQHYSIPESLGADVRLLRLQEGDAWLPDLDALADLVGKGAKLVSMTNPNNPTGSLMDADLLGRIVEICDRAGAYLLCDEVYRGIDQTGPGTTTSVADLYDKGISTGSMSKAFSLAGLRLGWVTGPKDLVQALTVHRDYNTISVGMIDDLMATMALEHVDAVLARSREIVRGNHTIVSDWVAQQNRVSWVPPQGGTTALLKYDAEVSSRDLCVDLVESTGVMLTPGSALDIEGYLRLGYANNRQVLTDGLDRLGEYLAR